jgi:cobalt/nickel transport system permease protein
MSFQPNFKIDSIIHKWQHQAKLVALLSLIFTFAFIEKISLLPIIILITFIFYILSRLPLSFLLKKLRYPGLLILTIVIFLPFISGKTVIFTIGSLALKKEGCLTVLLIITRLICILTLSVVLFATSPFLNIIKAMESFGLPDIILDMTVLSYRYLEELAQMLYKMQQSMQLRGFPKHKLNKRNLTVFAQLIGTLLIRSYEKSQRVYQAMILRGYGYKTSGKNKHHNIILIIKQDQLSWIGTAITILIAISLFIAQI